MVSNVSGSTAYDKPMLKYQPIQNHPLLAIQKGLLPSGGHLA